MGWIYSTQGSVKKRVQNFSRRIGKEENNLEI